MAAKALSFGMVCGGALSASLHQALRLWVDGFATGGSARSERMVASLRSMIKPQVLFDIYGHLILISRLKHSVGAYLM